MSAAGEATFNDSIHVNGPSTITTANNLDTLTLISTDADAAVGPVLDLYRNSGSPADDDFLGKINFRGRNDNSQDVDYGYLAYYISDASDGTEDAFMQLAMMKNGSNHLMMEVGASEIVFNQGSVDIDFRVESDGQTHALFVDGGLNNVGVGYSAAHTATNPGIVILSGGEGGGVQINREDGSTPSSGEFLGSLAFKGSDSANNNTAADASIVAKASQDHSGSAAGTNLLFKVKPNDTGPGSGPSTRMEIEQDGKIAIGNDVPIWSGSYGGAVFLKGNNATSARNARLCIVDSTGAQDGDKEIILDNDGDFNIKGGDLIFNTAGKGIVLGATSNTAANTLDDYEIGTWTPTIIGSTTNPVYGTSAAVGDYIKIGDIVHANFLIIVTSVSNVGAGNKSVSGLPFTQNQNSYQQVGLIGYNDVWSDAVTRFYITGSNLTIMPTGVTQSNYGGDVTTGYFSGSITYSTSS
jgi:hypothetical protein